MNTLITFNNEQVKFENLNILIEKMSVSAFPHVNPSDLPEQTAYSNVADYLAWHEYANNGLDAIGDIVLHLRNQNFDDNTALTITSSVRVRAITENDKASIFCKTLEYLFEVIKNKCETNEITDMKGNKFSVPVFRYSRENFANHFSTSKN